MRAEAREDATMKPEMGEHLSALMDGELGGEPVRFLLRRLEHEPDLASAWSRWHVLRTCLGTRHAPTDAAGDDAFAARVLAAVATPVRAQHRRWLKIAGGGAIAAGVAVTALMLAVPQTPGGDSGAHFAAGKPAAVPAAAIAMAPQAATPADDWQAAMRPALRTASADRAILSQDDALRSDFLQQRYLQPDYLQPAAYAPNAGPVLLRDPRAARGSASYMILLVPEGDAATRSATQH